MLCWRSSIRSRTASSEGVEQGGWFLWFHMIQLLLTGLIALAVYLLTDGLAGRAVSVSRWAIGVFAVFFSAYDAAAGIATGFMLSGAQGLPVDEQTAIYETAIDMPGLSLISSSPLLGPVPGWWRLSRPRWH